MIWGFSCLLDVKNNLHCITVLSTVLRFKGDKIQLHPPPTIIVKLVIGNSWAVEVLLYYWAADSIHYNTIMIGTINRVVSCYCSTDHPNSHCLKYSRWCKSLGEILQSSQAVSHTSSSKLRLIFELKYWCGTWMHNFLTIQWLLISLYECHSTTTATMTCIYIAPFTNDSVSEILTVAEPNAESGKWGGDMIWKQERKRQGEEREF